MPGRPNGRETRAPAMPGRPFVAAREIRESRIRPASSVPIVERTCSCRLPPRAVLLIVACLAVPAYLRGRAASVPVSGAPQIVVGEFADLTALAAAVAEPGPED